LLEPLRDLPSARVVHSVGSRGQLRALRRRRAGPAPACGRRADVAGGIHLLRSLAWRNVLGAAYPRESVPLRRRGGVRHGRRAERRHPGPRRRRREDRAARRRLHGSSVATIASSTPVLVVLDLLAATALLVALVATRGLPFAVSAPGTAVWLVPALVVAVLVAALGARHLRPRIARLWSQLRQGGAILRTRGRPAYPAGAGTVMTSARSSHLRRGRQAHLGLV
jgi:hypothetical protein